MRGGGGSAVSQRCPTYVFVAVLATYTGCAFFLYGLGLRRGLARSFGPFGGADNLRDAYEERFLWFMDQLIKSTNRRDPARALQRLQAWYEELLENVIRRIEAMPSPSSRRAAIRDIQAIHAAHWDNVADVHELAAFLDGMQELIRRLVDAPN